MHRVRLHRQEANTAFAIRSRRLVPPHQRKVALSPKRTPTWTSSKMLASALIPALLFSTALAQYTPSVNYYLSSIEATGEGFCPGRSPPPLKQRQCAAFHTLAVCSNNPAQNCRVAMDGILASIQSDNTTWACVTTNNVTAAALGVVCGAGGAPPCTAEVVVESVDVDCKAQNWFKVCCAEQRVA